MKKTVLFLAAAALLTALLAGCAGANPAPDNSQAEGPFTHDVFKDFADNVPVKIDDDILQTCYRYADNLGYEIKEKDSYASVLLGKSNVSYVYADDDRKDMVDEDDFLITFNEVRIVIDADTGVALGTIPFV